MIVTFALILFLSISSLASELLTNCAHFNEAPKWLNSSRVNRIADSVTRIMEWDIRRVEVVWYQNQRDFEAAHSMGPLPMAVTQRTQNRILLGPKVIDSTFDRVFGHELVHITSEQKYKDAIPKWLEEGVANYVAQFSKIDYVKLNKRPLPNDVTKMTHMMSGTQEDVFNNYALSQALTEMIASHCDFRNLLRLSVQRKMEDYLENICHIPDINIAFKKRVKDQSTKKKTRKK